MRNPSVLSLAVMAAMGVALPAAGRAAAIVIDHTTTDPAAISQADLDAARALKMTFEHASVGDNIWAGVGALRASNAGRYAFPNWTAENRGNPGWQAKIDDFEDYVAAHTTFQVYLNKLCYIDQDVSFTSYRDSMVHLAETYPGKTFVWFTIPITTTGNAERDAFNASVRAYVRDHGLVLYDIADIESHKPDGTAVTNGGYEAMYSAYSGDGGHPNAAEARLGGAMWHLMSAIATGHTSGGGDPGGGDSGGGGGGCSSAGGLGGALALAAALLPVVRLRRRRSR